MRTSFKTLVEFQSFVREHGAPDHAMIDGVLYTMDEYDMDGESITYGNVKYQKAFEVKTKNRYDKSLKFSDAICEEIMFFQRNDLTYDE